MDDSERKPDYKQLLRFYGYALSYWKLIVPALIALFVYTVMSVNVLVLVKPAVDTLMGEQVSESKKGEQGDSLGAFERMKRRMTDRALEFGPVRRFNDWIRTGDRLKKIALLLALVVSPLLFVSGFAYNYLQRRVVWNVMADLRVAVFERLSSLSLTYFSRQRTGDLVSRLTNDLQVTRNALLLLFGRIMQQPLRILGFLAVAVFYSWQLSIVVACSFPVIVFVQRRYGGRIRRYSRKNLERLADITDSITQMLQGIRVVKSFDQEESENARFRARTRAQLKRAYKLVRNRAWAESLPELTLGWSLALVIFVASRLVIGGGLAVADMFVCVCALTACTGPIRRVVKAYSGLQYSAAGVGRLFELLDSAPQMRDSADAVEIDGVKEAIRFEDVWFAYDGEPVLKGISLNVPAGKTYAIVGETGAGKSTLLDLVPRFYDVERGSISVDGVDVRSIKHRSLMRQIAIVSQHPFLFNRTIEENIRYGKPGASDEEVRAAARSANVHEFIMSLPQGYQTQAGEMGNRFSGGQRQCITIARALLKNAPILILDEATSNLDAASEMHVQEALANLIKGRTTFVIAHRLSTVRRADRIIVLKDGRIVEQGVHMELLARGGEYERLYRSQFMEDAAEREEGARDQESRVSSGLPLDPDL
ncbi:MAG: ABC transporter ATP-binding protein [Planctomycetes bacterium]|nr:ABC transporter ATP-binding protein [Planctomycetota bacterium]